MALISGLFLKNKVAQRITVMLLLAAILPALLTSSLTFRNMSRLIENIEQQDLKKETKNYGLTVMGNLLFAKTLARHFTEINRDNNYHINILWDALEEKTVGTPMFNSVVEVSTQGEVIAQQGHAKNLVIAIQQLNGAGLSNLKANKLKPSLLVIPQKNQQPPLINLILPQVNGQNSTFITELNPDFIWGLKADYPNNIKMCVYKTINHTKTELFCSQSIQEVKSSINANKPKPVGQWDLFLKAEFQEDDWQFETTRLKPSATNQLWDFYSDYGFIWVIILSLLIIGLLSINQIRKTMVPLEKLIEGTRSISQGKFENVVVNDHSEFSELADAFNNMSSDIQRQLNTLQVFSEVDQKMVAKLDVDDLIVQILSRIQQLKPGTSAQIFRLSEKNSTEALGVVNLIDHNVQSNFPLSIPIQEINSLAAYTHGEFINHDIKVQFQHTLIQLGAKFLWVLPVFWQGNICAFLTIGSPIAFEPKNNADWNEIRDLSNRIGMAISAQKREEQLLKQAHYDLLTGLPNRVLLDDRLQQAIERSNRSKWPTWVVFLDLDRFKYINDSMGHHTGDQVLVEISKRLQHVVRETDTVARFGGDEFIIILEGQNSEELMMPALNRIVENVATPLIINHIELNMTCSAGVAIYPNDGDNPNVLIQHADIAMYRAKELGKNNIQFYTEELNKKVADHIYIENLLRHAIEKNELVLHYQPKVNIKTMQIVGMEALIRWNSKELGFISPVRFIPIAEETGLIVAIGQWVIKTACEQAIAWQKAGYSPLLMSVNLSTRQFNQTNLVDSIKATLAETGLKAQYFELELTESILMMEVEKSMIILNKIKSLGVKISVDDFGTGYSSLAYLKNLPVDTLKIDKSFTDDIVKQTDNVPIVQTIIALAKNLNLKIVAEGVETHEQVLYLKAHQCDEIQGYYFSKPKLPAELEPLLQNPVFSAK
ncbi:MAG: EAL domain-containing protein [Methylophilaceae bacterium]